MEQDTARPTAKVATGGIAGALTLLVVFIVGKFGVDVPAEVAAAVTVLISFAASYIKRERSRGEHVAE